MFDKSFLYIYDGYALYKVFQSNRYILDISIKDIFSYVKTMIRFKCYDW